MSKGSPRAPIFRMLARKVSVRDTSSGTSCRMRR